jgi:hypothetical protein
MVSICEVVPCNAVFWCYHQHQQVRVLRNAIDTCTGRVGGAIPLRFVWTTCTFILLVSKLYLRTAIALHTFGAVDLIN